MINAILLNSGLNNGFDLHSKISDCCPQLNMTSSVFSPTKYNNIIERENPQVIFLEIDDQYASYSELFQNLQSFNIETILIASNRDFIFEAVNYKISGYLLKPLNKDSLKSTVDFAIKRTFKKENTLQKRISPKSDIINKMIGIPTMEGYEFFPVEEIIRCESYLKCTRVITKDRTDIISSYNIGQFTNVLDQYGFYSPHQSHLINLNKIKKYLKEGTIIMYDNSSIPVSRRKKNDFLNQIHRI